MSLTTDRSEWRQIERLMSGGGQCKAKDDDDEYFVRCVDLSLSYHLIDDVH